MTQVYFNGQGVLWSRGPAMLPASSDAVVDSDSLRALPMVRPTAFSFLSPGVEGVAAGGAVGLKSKAVPGVLGVLLAEPNEAKAPEPKPNAEEPAVVGEASGPAANGEIALNGFLAPCADVSPPKRFVAENVREGGSDLSP